MLTTNFLLINRANLVKEIKTECTLLEKGKNRDSEGSPIHISTTTAKLMTLIRAYNEELAEKKGKKVDTKTCQALQVEEAQVKNLITRITSLAKATIRAPSWIKPVYISLAVTGLAALIFAAYRFDPFPNSSQSSLFDEKQKSFFDPYMCPNPLYPLSVNQIPKPIINVPVQESTLHIRAGDIAAVITWIALAVFLNY